MYYRKIEGDKIYLSPMDKKNEIPLLTRWFNEDPSIACNNGFISSVSNEEDISEMVDKWNESGMIFSIINKIQFRILQTKIAIIIIHLLISRISTSAIIHFDFFCAIAQNFSYKA